MAENIYHKNPNTKSPLLDKTGTPLVGATNNAQSVPTFERDQYLTPYNETEKGEQANAEPTQKVETPTTTKESPLSPSVETPKEETPKAEAEPMKFNIPTLEGYKEKPTAPTLTTAETSVVSTPIRKSYKNFYDEYMDVAKHNYALAQSQGRTTSQIFADMAKRLTPEGMAQSFGEFSAMQSQAKQYADAMSTTATDFGIEKTLSEMMSGWKSDKKLFDADVILSQLEKTDGDGNKFYQFYGGEIYGDAARKIVKRYVDEHNHWVNMADKDYRERWSMAKYGIPYEEFVDRRMEVKIKPALQKLTDAANAYYRSDEYRMKQRFGFVGDVPLTAADDNLAAELAKVKGAADSFRDGSFVSGLKEGIFPALKNAMHLGVGVIMDSATMMEQVSALNKLYEGKPLSAREEFLVALWEANEIIEEETNLYRKGGSIAKTTSDAIQNIGTSAGIVVSGAQQLGNMLGKKLLGEAAEQSFLKVLKNDGFKTAIKMTAKAAPKKLAVSATTSAVKAGVSSMTARNFAEDRLDQFKMTQLGLMKEENNPLASLWKAYAMSFGEWFTEDLGDVADDILALGRRAALNKVFSGKLSKALTRLDDFKATSAVRNFLRDARIQGLTAEAGSELLNNYIQPLLTGEFFWDISQDGFMSAANKHYSDVLTWESTWDTITQSAIIAGTGMMSRGISGAMQGWQISSLRNQIRETLGDVQNEGLRNQLYELINSDTPNFAPLAGINWKSEGINVEDAQRAMQVVFKSAQVQEMRGEFEETQRLAAFAPQLQYILQRAYKGVDIAAPTETLEEIEIKKGDDTLGYVLYGDVDSPNQVLQIVDGNGQVHNIATESLKAEGYEFKRKSIGDAISEQYALMFSNQISQERLGDVIESVRGYRGADAETKQRIIEANGFSVYKNGAAVTLVDGRMAVVKGNAENGQYTVDILGADGKVADTAMVGFEYILNENDPNMAQAQMEAQARGALGSPIVLPTKDGGRISLDEINDSQTLADLLPSQVGGKAKAVAVIDAEIERLKAMQGSQSKKVGLDAVADNVQQEETIANRIAVLEDTRKRLGGAPKAQPKTREEVAKENEAKQAERDGMSTFEFSQDYRRRMGNTKVSRNALKTFINSIDEGLAVLDETLKDNEATIAKKEAEISNAFSRATSEVDLDRIAEEQKTAVAKLNTLKAERAEMEADRKKMQHRKAQYEQALKDMGGNTDTKYQEGTIGADKRVFDFAKKASEILGMPVVVTEKEFTSNRQGGVHRVDEDGKSAIYINPNSTAAEQGVGILAHEIVHELKTILNKKEWAKLETYIMGAAFGRKWRGSKGYQSLIDSIQAAERRSGHKEGISDDKAREEAVAYTIQDLIFAGERGMKAMEAIFADSDTKWTEKVRTVFKNLLAKIKTLFSSSNDQKLQEAIKVFEESLHRVEEKKKAGYNYAKRAKKDASGKESHSLATFNDWVDDRGVTHKGTRTMFVERMNANGFTDEEKADMVARMDTAYEYMVKLQEFTDEDGNLRFDAFNEWAKTTPHYKQIGRDYVKAITSLVSNGDYPINLELTTDCIKREAFTALVNELAKRGVNMGAMRPAQIMVLQNMMQQYGIEVACKLCFVEGKRLGIVNWAETIVQDWNDALIEAGIDTDEYFDFGKDGEVVVPTTPLREIERGHEQKVAWDAIFEVDLIMQGQDAKAFKAQMQKNLKAVKEYKKQRAEEWANKTKKPRNPADWKPTKDDQKHIDELMSQGVTVAQVGKNASEYREAFNRMREAWIEKNPKKDPLSFNPTKKQWDALDKIRNREIATVKAKMVRLIMEHPGMRKKMQLKDLLGSKGLMEIRNQDGEAFADLWSIILQRFGTGTPKPIQDATPYDGEIMGLTESQFDKANKIGGARLFSFSDFDITKIFDYMQMFFDLEANKQMLQSYTKEVPAVIALGRSNAKINISTLANADVPAEVKEQYEKANADGKKALRHKMSENAGLLLDEDGNIVGINFSKEHSVKPEFAQEIFHDDTRNKDCGAIMVGDSVNHAIYSAAQDWIRMVIPFHLSGIPLAAREKADTLWYFDNTPYQSTRKRSGEEGWTKLGTADKDFEFYNDMDKKGWNMRDKAREYIAWCEARGYRPKFDWGINSDYYRAFCEQEGFTPNQQIIDMMDADTTDGVWNQYYKFLTDFTAYKPVFNEKGEMIDEIPSPQLPVKATFDFSEMEREVLFEGEGSMLAHREGNIKRTQEHIGELADKATAFLLGDVTEEELGLRDDVHYENYADAEKYLEAKANSLQKRPNTQEVVSGADVAESYSISRNNEAVIDKWLGKREDFTDDIKNAFKDYIADFKPATQLATTKWFANGVIRIPEDMPKVEQAMEIAQRKKVDALQFKSPMEIIDQFGDVFKPKAKLINPDDVPTLSNKVQVPNTDITIYDVEDSEESRKNFRELMNSHLGKDANPWCLMQAEDGVLRADSKDYWEKYNKYQRRAAFKGGKLIAFFASDGEPTWWDRMDQPHDHIPIVGKIKGDELGRTATLLYNEENGEMMGYDDIRKGARGDAYYAEWYDLDTMKEESRYDKATGNGSERYFYEDGSVELYKVIEADREMQRVHFDRQGNVTSQTESNGWLDYSSVWQDGAKQKISIDGRGQYLRIEWDGSDVKGLDYTWQGKREVFTFETNAYKSEETNLQKRYLWSYGSNEWMFRRSKLLRVTTNKEYKAAIFEDRTSVEIKNVGENSTTTLERLPVGDVVYYINITNSNDGQHEKVDIENVGSINDGVRVLNEGITDALVDEIMAEVKQRLDIVDRVASDINKDSEMQRKRSAKLAQMYHPDNVSDVRSLDEANILLDKARADITSTRDSFSIDRSQYLEGPEIDRAYASRSMDMIDSKVGTNKPLAIASIINIVEKLAADDERKMMRGKMSAIDAKYAQEFINTYRAVANYGRAVLAEKFPEYIENSHEDNIKSGKTDLSKIRELFQKYNTDGEMAELFNLVSSVAEKFGTTFRFAALDNTTHGDYVGNAVRYKVGTLNSDIISDQDKATIILHEMIHAATSSAITLCENAQWRGLLKMSPSVKLRTSVRRLKTLLEDIRSNEEFKGEYGITDVHEMLAELSNPRFVEKLKKHDIWTRIVDGIREIASAIVNMVTGKDVAKSDAYTEVRTTLTEIIDETPMEFVEGLNRLRDAGRIKGVKPLVAESADEIASLAESEGTASYSLVRDEAKIAELEASPKRIGYRNMVLNEDGTLSAPMASSLSYPSRKKDTEVKMAVSELGKWEQADEHPELVNEKGKVTIYQPENGAGTTVNYDPYIHSRQDRVNTQLKGAWRRPNLVYVEVEIPTTDLESGYQADKAALPVGAHEWAGGSGIVMLSMYDKPVRIADWNDVADDWMKRFGNEPIHFDIIPPQLLPILAERGANITSPHPGLGVDVYKAYDKFKAEQGVSYSLNIEETLDYFTLSEDNETDFEWALMQAIAGSSYSATSSYKVLGDVEIRVKSHTPNWDNFLDLETDEPRYNKILNVTVGDFNNTDYRRNKTDYENFVKEHPSTIVVNVEIEEGTSLSKALTQIHEALQEKGIDFEFAPDFWWVGKYSAETNDLSESSYSLSIEDTDTIFATAKEEFASTNDWKKTGWLMPDGTQLDFAEGGDYRGTDHRAIGAAYKGVAEHQWQYLQDFESRGGIRIHMNRDGKYGTIEMTIKPTAEQKKRLRSFIGAVGGNVDVDFMDANYNTAHSASYEGVSPARVLSGITSFYDEGIKPKGNVSESYSLSRERADIERKAKADGTWLKAPNGKDTNLTPEQWVDVRTSRFKSWFGDWENDPENASKIVDENGEPRVMHHGSSWRPLQETDGKAVFNMEDGALGKGAYFTSAFPEAADYARDSLDNWDLSEDEIDDDGYVTDVFLNVRDDAQILRDNAYGNDSFIVVATSPNQIKSATENIGTFDSANDDIRYSLNRDDVTIATPEMEAEANEELSKEEMDRDAIAIQEAETAILTFEEKIAKQDRKKFTYDVVRDFIKSEMSRNGLQEATRGQYNAILKNVLDILKDEEADRGEITKGELLFAIKLSLTNARIKLAKSNLTKAGKDFKKVITKKREGKNTRGEVIQKYVSDEVRLIVEEFTNAINTLFAEEKDGKTLYRYDDVMKAGTVLVSSDGKKILEPINDAILELEERAEEGEAFAKGVTNLLETFRNVREIALRVNGIRNEASNIDSKIKPFEDKLKEIRELRKLIKSVRNSSENWQSAWRAIRSSGFATIEQAEARLAELQQEAEANEFGLNLLRGDKQMTKSIEADLMTELVEAVRDMNTAINSLDKEGRIALKEELAKKKEADIEFKRGILRSIRSPYYINAVGADRHNTKRNKGQLTRSQRRDMLRRGDGFLDAIVDSLEYVLRKMDRMSMPNQWLQTGIYYQFIMHPTQGILARVDWRYKTEKALREMLNKKATEMLAPKGVGSITIEDLNLKLKEESGIIINPYRSNIKGEAVSSSAAALPINLTVDQLLYIRAMVAQDGGIKGYLTLGLTVDRVNSIIKETEARYPELCAFDDWIRGEGGFMDEVYKIRNEIYRKLYGRDLPHTKGYFPIQRLAMAIHSYESVGETISINTIAGGIGSNKERVQNALPMDINVGYFEKLESHINESMQWCQEIELVEKMNVLLASPMFRDILKEQGITKEKFKNAFLRGIGERLGEGNSKNQTFNRIISSATKHIVAANVSFNLNAALKQLVSSTAAFSQELNPKLWAHFVKNFLVPTFARSGVSAIKKTLEDDISIDQVVSMPIAFGCWKWARENMPTFAERIDTGTLGYDIFEQDGIETWDKINSYINKVGLSANRFFDLLTCSVVGKTYYDFWKERNLERGMTEQEAHDDARMRAAILVNQTQQSSLGAFLGKIQADKGDTVTALWRAVIVSYNNSNISFDRNTRAATIAINTMIHDTFVDPEVRNKIIEYKAEEYVSRGIEEEEAKKLARKDYTESFFTQLNQFVHNGILNHIFWAIGGHMSTILPHIPMLLGMISNHYDEDDEALSYEYIKKQLLETLKGGWIYLAPGSSNILSKGWWESVAEGKFERGVAVNIQPLADSIDAWIKWLSSDEYVTDEEQKQLRLQAFLVTFDMATKVGFGFSSRTLTRMYNGFKGLKKEGYEIEHIYNILSTPRQTTSWFVGRPRKDEKRDMNKYVERVAGMQKVVKGLGKGEDDSKIRKQYIDRMDELMFYGTDFDYDKFKEDKSMVNKYTKRLAITPKGQLKEGRQAPTPEDFWKIGFMYKLASYAEKSERTLSHPMKCNWDNDGANERRELYELADVYVQTFYRIKDAKSEEDIREILSVFVEKNNKYTIPRLEAAGVKNTEDVLQDVNKLMQKRKDVIERRKNINK